MYPASQLTRAINDTTQHTLSHSHALCSIESSIKRKGKGASAQRSGLKARVGLSSATINRFNQLRAATMHALARHMQHKLLGAHSVGM